MRRIELAYPYTDAEGTRHEADSVVELPNDVAVELLAYGRARPATDQAASRPAPAPSTTA